MAGRLWAHRYDEHLPAGAASPYELAYNHNTSWGREGDLWFEPLKAGTVTFDGARNGKSGWSRPAFWARDLANGQTFVVELAWSGNWQFELTCQMDEGRREAQLCFAMGMAPAPSQGEMLRVLNPGESVRSPAVHIAYFQRDVDAIVQSTHRHVRHTILPAAPEGCDIEIEANHRGYLCDRENEPDLKRDIDIAADLGAELYMIDAGWYGREPNQWGRNVGDWFSGPWLANGLEAIVGYAHAKGLRFGLWVEIEAAGDRSLLREQHPEWAVRRRGQPVADGRALDLANPEVAAWVESEIVRLVGRFQLDMFRLDHNHSMGLGGTCERDGFTENTLWCYYEALYGIFDRVRARYPGLVFQNCAGGGGRLDWGILQHFHNTEISDWMRQPRAMVILNGLSMALPPEVCLRTFGTEVGEHALEADLDAQLRLMALCRPIFRGIAPTLDELNPLAKERIAHFLALYKAFLRPVMREGLFFHHTPWLHVGAPAPWCVLECASPDSRRAAVVLFRYTADDPGVYHLTPRGLDRRLRYRVVYDNSGEAVELGGQALMDAGLQVRVANRYSSELLLFEALGPTVDKGPRPV
jgi:alpha-galactosidase